MQYLVKTCRFKRIDCRKLKQGLKYRSYVYFKSVRPNVLYQALNYLKTHNEFYDEDISIVE